MHIRPAEEQDLDAVAALAVETFVEAFGATLQATDLEAHLAGPLGRSEMARAMREDAFLLAEVEGHLAGFAQFGAAHGRAGGDQALRRLYVRAGLQDRGIGGALLRAALASPAMRRARRIWLDVWEHNHGARRLYERHGFEVVDRFRLNLASGPADSLELVMLRRQRAP